MQEPVQYVKQFVQQPVYQQPVQVVQTPSGQQYVPVQRPVRYVVPEQQQQTPVAPVYQTTPQTSFIQQQPAQ